MSIIDLGRAENNNLDRIAIIHDRETERRKHRVSLIPFDEIKLGAEAREEFGHEAVKIARAERPVEYLRVVASLLPKEFEFTDNRLADLSDDELDAFIELAKRQLGSRAADVGSGEEPTLN